MSTLTFIALMVGAVVLFVGAFGAYSALQLSRIGTEEWLRKHGPRIQKAEARQRESSHVKATAPSTEEDKLPRTELQRMAEEYLRAEGAGALGIYQPGGDPHLVMASPWTAFTSHVLTAGLENFSLPMPSEPVVASPAGPGTRMDDVIRHAVQSLKVAPTEAEADAVLHDLEVRLHEIIERSASNFKGPQGVFGGGLSDPLMHADVAQAGKPRRR